MLQASYSQQISMLSSLLDKVSEFSSRLNAFGAIVSSGNRKLQGAYGRKMLAQSNQRKDQLLQSCDVVNVALAQLAEIGLLARDEGPECRAALESLQLVLDECN